MRRRVSFLALVALTSVSVGSLGVSDCSDDLIKRLASVIADHGQRIAALEKCDCDGVVAVVCGDDRNTYLNACEARCAGTEIASVGRCAELDCGGPESLACDPGRFCETRPGCDALAFGTCEEVPEACSDQFAPVCGCDGQTYANDCERRVAGIPLDFRGDCAQPPVSCNDNDACGDDEFCGKRKGVCDTKPGVCAPRPEACTQQFDPVCGCDGKTYDNECVAAVAGVTIADTEACEPEKVAICHVPPGNPGNRHTIYVGEAALPAHLGHGDFRGPCEGR